MPRKKYGYIASDTASAMQRLNLVKYIKKSSEKTKLWKIKEFSPAGEAFRWNSSVLKICVAMVVVV